MLNVSETALMYRTYASGGGVCVTPVTFLAHAVTPHARIAAKMRRWNRIWVAPDSEEK